MNLGMKSVLLLLTLAVVALSACGGKSEPQARDVQEGAALFASRNCVTCHGAEAEGQPAGPELRGLDEFYTQEELVEYLKNPDAAMERDGRLRKRSEGFGALMPRYNYLPQKELEKLAIYVLSL